MITVKCQHSGIEFETKSNRTKQHPLVAAFKNDNAKKNYAQAVAALEQAASLRYATIEEYMALVKQIFSGEVNAKNEQINARNFAEAEAEKARYEAKKRREAQNAKLRAHGYRWMRDDADGYQPQFNDDAWHLISPDGYEVTVAEAMAEIESGVDTAVAARAEAKAALEAEAKVAQEAEAAETAAYHAAYDSVASIEVEQFDAIGFETIYERKDFTVTTMIKRVQRGQVNGVPAGVTYWYGSASGESTRYWCDDPVAAGLVKAAKTSASDLFW